jgi:L-alanine-DL-glutamate epimerase-like enolase superfamily enzyme
MSKATDIRVKHVETKTQRFTYRTPIKFGGRVVVDAVVFDVEMEVETRDGRRGRGVGSMPMANAWAWPSRTVGGDQALTAMMAFAERFAQRVVDCDAVGHPLEVSHAWAPLYASLAAEIAAEHHLAEPPPVLARMVAASPVEAAVHDAFGKTIGANSYNLLGPDYVNTDLSHYLSPEFRGEYLDRYTLRQPQPRLPLYHLVGALDPLETTDVTTPVGDGLPETLEEWIGYNGLTHLKIKLAGDDLEWDVNRVVAIDRVAERAQARRGCAAWNYSLDFNEKCASVQYVLDFLAQVETRSPRGLARVQYIEQPTHRDLKAFPENRMHAAALVKPVVIDESLTDYDSLLLARELGYSGVALKACKGHSEALLMGAAAQKHGLFLCVQDLTCIGRSFLHSASLAARIPTIAAIEGNGRQYCPAGNVGWDARFPTMFTIRDGSVGAAALSGHGLWGE